MFFFGGGLLCSSFLEYKTEGWEAELEALAELLATVPDAERCSGGGGDGHLGVSCDAPVWVSCLWVALNGNQRGVQQFVRGHTNFETPIQSARKPPHCNLQEKVCKGGKGLF